MVNNVFIKVIVSVSLTVIIIVAFLYFLNLGYSPASAVIDRIEKKDYNLFETEFNVQFTPNTIVKSVTVMNGKDYLLQVDLIVPHTELDTFNASIESDYQSEGTTDSSIERVLITKGSDDLQRIVYKKSNDSNSLSIILAKYRIRNNEILKMANKAGFHPIKKNK
jgi:hypothetical protein